MHATLLIISDDEALSSLISEHFACLGWCPVARGLEGPVVEHARQLLPQLIILAAPMRAQHAQEILHALRQEFPKTALISAGQNECDVLTAFDLGADDVVCTPVKLNELDARARVALQHYQGHGNPQGERYDDGILDINLDCSRVYMRGKQVHLSPTEFRLLAHLVRHKNSFVPHEVLLTQVWGETFLDQRPCLHLYIRYLRAKLEDNPARPRYIKTKRGKGYAFVASPTSKR